MGKRRGCSSWHGCHAVWHRNDDQLLYKGSRNSGAGGIEAEVVHLASIKPIDRELIAASASKTGCAVSAENASIMGGFGAAVAEVLAETCPIPLERIGVRDRFVNSGGTVTYFESTKCSLKILPRLLACCSHIRPGRPHE